MAVSDDVCGVSVAQRAERGRAARKVRPRVSIADFTPAADRVDPVQQLAAQEVSRVPALLPLRHERMSADAFAFLRGAATVMAADLGAQPNSGLNVQLCGDAHLSNFGLFASPDRRVVFDLNDFDETNRGPFEWDVQRLATSFVLGAREAGHPLEVCQTLPEIVARSYRDSMKYFAAQGDLDTWYYRVDTDRMMSWAGQGGEVKIQERAVRRTTKVARGRDRWSAVRKLTHIDDHRRRFNDDPPLLVSIPMDDEAAAVIRTMFDDYRSSLLPDRAELLSRYEVVDVGHKVVGVGSVGMLAFVILLQGRDEEDMLVLQAKEATTSVLEPFSGAAEFAPHGRRVVVGQQLMQATSDAFLGWVNGPRGRSFYIRQLRDMKWGPNPFAMTVDNYKGYAAVCGHALARAHARSGDAVALSAYLGESIKFDVAVARFASTYSEQSDRDYARYLSAIKDGEVAVVAQEGEEIRPKVTVHGDGAVTVSLAGEVQS